MDGDTIFTDYIRTLSVGSVGDIPEQVIAKLRGMLRTPLRRRGLLNCSPQVLGYAGRSWADSEAMESLVYDCFIDVFWGTGDTPGKQLEYLKDQVQAGNEIDALVCTKIRHFVHDLHRKAFPKDSGVYKNLTKALRLVVDADEPKLSVVAGSVNKFDRDSLFGRNQAKTEPVAAEILGEYVRVSADWSPALARISKFGKRATRLAQAAIESTADAEKIPFLFGDLKDVVSEYAFEPAETMDQEVGVEFTGENGESPVQVRTIRDDDRYEATQGRFHKQIELAHEAVDALSRRDSIKRKLHQILDCYARRIGDGESLKQSEIATELGIAKQTMSDYMKTIRELLESCQSSMT